MHFPPLCWVGIGVFEGNFAFVIGLGSKKIHKNLHMSKNCCNFASQNCF